MQSGGVWRPDYGSAATVHFDHLGPYNHSLYSNYYTLEDGQFAGLFLSDRVNDMSSNCLINFLFSALLHLSDYYGAYGDLLEYEVCVCMRARVCVCVKGRGVRVGGQNLNSCCRVFDGCI